MPTHITKLNDKYFIVDCYHHRIIWSDSLDQKIEYWNTIDVEFAGCHSIASDGDIYVIENAGYNEVIVLDNELKFKQRIYDIGSRPHRTIYDPATDAFYVISAPDIYCFKKAVSGIELWYKKTIPFLQGTYVRSFKIIEGRMYLISGNGYINVVEYADSSYNLIESYPVPFFMSFMNDIAKVGDYFYLTATQDGNQNIVPSAVRIKDLSRLEHGEYEDIYSKLGFTATPYFIEMFDNQVFITEIGDTSRIMSFQMDDVSLSAYTNYFVFGLPNEEDIKRRDMYPR